MQDCSDIQPNYLKVNCYILFCSSTPRKLKNRHQMQAQHQLLSCSHFLIGTMSTLIQTLGQVTASQEMECESRVCTEDTTLRRGSFILPIKVIQQDSTSMLCTQVLNQNGHTTMIHHFGKICLNRPISPNSDSNNFTTVYFTSNSSFQSETRVMVKSSKKDANWTPRLKAAWPLDTE